MSLSLDSTLYVRFFWLQPSKSSTPSNPLTAGSPQNARLEDDCPFQVGDFLSSMLNFPVGVYKWSEKKKSSARLFYFPRIPDQTNQNSKPCLFFGVVFVVKDFLSAQVTILHQKGRRWDMPLKSPWRQSFPRAALIEGRRPLVDWHGMWWNRWPHGVGVKAGEWCHLVKYTSSLYIEMMGRYIWYFFI